MELYFQSALELARMIRDREVSATEVIEAHLRRIEAVNPKLNAIVYLAADEAVAAVRQVDQDFGVAGWKPWRPLFGVPITVKDNIPVAGMTMTNGTLGQKDFVPEEDATVVRRLRDAGAIILGKTNLPEIGMAGETDNLVYGRTNNPYDLNRSPGGSSGGEAAIIAAGGSALGIGTDIGGSIRHPAFCCGLAGIKPGLGRVPWHTPFGFADELRQTGPLARTVDDASLGLRVLAGPDWHDPSAISAPLGGPEEVDIPALRLAYHADNGVVTPADDIISAVSASADVMRDAGCAVFEAVSPGLAETLEIFGALLGSSGGQQYRDVLEAAGTGPDQISPLIRDFLDNLAGAEISTIEFQRAILRWDQYRSDLWGFFQQYDAMIAPVYSQPALPHGTLSEHAAGLSYNAAYNLAGLPSAVVRTGATRDGIPVGVQIVAAPWREDIALAVAKVLEDALGGWQPPNL